MVEAKKKEDNSVPQALPGNSWLVFSRTPGHPQMWDDAGYVEKRIVHPTFKTLSVQKGHFNLLGLGTIALVTGYSSGKTTADNLLASVSGTLELGELSFLTDRVAAAIVERAPTHTNEAMMAIEASQLALSLVTNQRRCSFPARFKQDRPEQVVIAGEEYGTAYVPKSFADGLKVAEDGDESLRFSHVFVDLLGTKHDLMTQLGLGAYIQTDQRLIQNALEYAARQGTR